MKTPEKRKAVLLVGESYFIHNEFADLCQKHGYDIASISTDSNEILAGLRLKPEVVIVDYTMERNDPYLAVAFLRNSLPSSYIALMDGNRQHCDRNEAKKAGANKILSRNCKAIDYEVLLHNVEEEIYL